MPVLALSDLRYAHPDSTPVFDGLTVSLPPGRTGLVGGNGAGKSTLIALVSGRLPPSGGDLRIDGRLSVLSQTPDPGSPVAGIFGRAAQVEVLRRADAGTASAEDLADADWDLESRIGAALAGVGLEDVDLLLPVGRLSGGQRIRVALAAAFFDAPDLVLLDEPTNNLDAEGRALVSRLLAAHGGAALVASHDRRLLADMDQILALEAGGAALFGGGWDAYVAERAAARDRAEARLERAGRELRAAEREIARREQAAAGRARQGKALRRSGSQGKMLLDKMKEGAEQAGAGAARLAQRRREIVRAEFDAARAEVATVTPRRLVAASSERSAQVVLEIAGASFGYDRAPLVLKDVSLQLARGERLALEGANGSGKSTLLRLAAGHLRPASGTVELRGQAAFLDQHAEVLGTSGSLEEVFRRAHPGLGRNAAHAALARMGFRGEAGMAEIARLSGGERVQAALAMVLAAPTPPDLLILDEPTNHLDLQALEAVESGLASYEGALLVVSHDPVFLEHIGVTRRRSLGVGG